MRIISEITKELNSKVSGNILISTFQKLRQMLRIKALVITGNEQDADDALQNAFCNLWKKSDLIDNETAAEGMSHTVVKNESINILRSHSRHSHQPIDTLGETYAEQDSVTDSNALFLEIQSIIEFTLSEREREILYKREMYGYEFSELAQEFGITEANARMIVSRARKQIRQCYIERTKSNNTKN